MDKLAELIIRSMKESNENYRRSIHNCSAETESLIPYSNTAFSDMADMVEALLNN